MRSEDAREMTGLAETAHTPSHAELLRESCAALLRDGQRVRFRATGLSMDPTIRDGDVLTVEPVDLGEVRPGEILLYRTARGVIAHRLVRCETAEAQLRYVLRGDASGTCDPPVSYGDVLGRATAVRRGRRSRSLTNPWTRQWQVAWAAVNRLARAALYRVVRRSP
jgi:signal peptidase I